MMLRMTPEVGRNKPTQAGVSGEASRLDREIRLPETPVNGLIPALVRNISYFSLPLHHREKFSVAFGVLKLA